MDQHFLEAINRTISAHSVWKVRLGDTADDLATRLHRMARRSGTPDDAGQGAGADPVADPLRSSATLSPVVALQAAFHRHAAAVAAEAQVGRRARADSAAILGASFERASGEFAQALGAVRRSLTAC